MSSNDWKNHFDKERCWEKEAPWRISPRWKEKAPKSEAFEDGNVWEEDEVPPLVAITRPSCAPYVEEGELAAPSFDELSEVEYDDSPVSPVVKAARTDSDSESVCEKKQ